MRLASVEIGGKEVAAVVWAGGALPVAEFPDPGGWPTDLLSLLEGGRLEDLRRTRDRLSEREREDLSGRAIPAESLSYAPLYRRPRKIWGIGLNYADHAGDLDEAAPAEEPASFMRPDTTIIGREAKNISEDKAPSVVAGFTTGLDTTAEGVLRRNPRYLTRDKSFDTFFSFGPHLLTQDEVGEVGALEVATVLNGEARRKNTVSNMTFSPYRLVSFHSRVMTLLPSNDTN